MNNVKVFGLMALMTALVAAVAGAIGGRSVAVVALVMAAVLNFIMYFASSSIVLRMYRAQVVTPQDAPELYAMVDRLRQQAGLPMPTVAIAPHEQPNAFATGRNPSHAVVCVTAGILRLIDRDELEGVLAHEIAHVKNRDTLLQTFTATLAGAISYLGQMALFGAIFGRGENRQGGGGILMAILAPLAAGLIQMAISRQREYKADAVGAQICGRPLSLATALEKLDAYAQRIPMRVAPAAEPLPIINPLTAYKGGIMHLFSTHPPTEKRVAALRRMAGA